MASVTTTSVPTGAIDLTGTPRRLRRERRVRLLFGAAGLSGWLQGTVLSISESSDVISTGT